MAGINGDHSDSFVIVPRRRQQRINVAPAIPLVDANFPVAPDGTKAQRHQNVVERKSL
jgi:hypothetical protein